MNIERVLEGREICICAGSGGVGKTTASAAIAMGMAARGKKVAVLTIDPAKRLANSLGLPELGNEERLVDPSRFAAHGLEMKGELWAMMLDAKRTFDDLIERHAPDRETRDNILQNRVYQQVSNALAGSQEYMAMEKLYELYREDRYDLLVLDTPPTRNALDFLEAPDRMTRFVSGKSLQFFLKPTRLGARIVGRGGGMVFSILKRITGIDLLKDLSEFFQSFSGMYEGFAERAERVKALLSQPRTTFVLVSAPEREPIDEAVFFWRKLAEAKLPFGCVIVNKVHPDYLQGGHVARDEAETILKRSLNGTPGRADLAERLAGVLTDHQLLAERDRDNIARLGEEFDDERLILVPYLDDDVHDIDGLMQVNRYLFASAAERAELAAAVAL